MLLIDKIALCLREHLSFREFHGSTILILFKGTGDLCSDGIRIPAVEIQFLFYIIIVFRAVTGTERKIYLRLMVDQQLIRCDVQIAIIDTACRIRALTQEIGISPCNITIIIISVKH